MNRLKNKKKITIVVTDSGLGGLSTLAFLSKRLTENGCYTDVNLVYFNALADYSMGYNSMKSTEQKVAVFNNALAAMFSYCRPDIIFIACNTLSVLYDQTEFSRNASIPVIDITTESLRLMRGFLNKSIDSHLIIMGTPTTIESNYYTDRLLEEGFPEKRIVTEACSTVHVEIENDVNSPRLFQLIQTHAQHALSKSADLLCPIGISLNCTHYDYVKPLFKKAFEECGAHVQEILSPNYTMADCLFTEANNKGKTGQRIKIISQAKISEETLTSIAHLIEQFEPKVAVALKNYIHKDNLFEWKTLANILS